MLPVRKPSTRFSTESSSRRHLRARICARRVMGVLTTTILLAAGCMDDAPAGDPPLDATLSPSMPEASVSTGVSSDAASSLDAAIDASSAARSDANLSAAPDAGSDTGTVALADGSTRDAAPAGDAGSTGDAGDAGASGMLSLTSSVVKNGEMLPAKYRCMSGGGTGPSLPLSWTGAPPNTQSFALLMRDRTFMNYQHWTLYDIPAATTSLPEGVPAGAMTMPTGAKQASNSRGLTGPGYFGPCGMSGVNTYELTLYALSVAMLPNPGTTGTSVEAALATHVLAMSSLSVRSGP